jgi:tetratricopeptide (TPR) repeat protein
VTAGVPKVKRIGRSGSTATYVLLGLVAVLLVVVAVLLFGGPLFDNEPRTDLERDYQQLLDGAKEYPDNPAVLMTLAEVEYLMGKKRDALEHAAKAAELGEEVAGIPLRYAQILLQEGQYEEALVWADLEIELAAEQKSAEPKFVKAQILWAMGEREEAIELLDRALEIGYVAADMRIVYAGWLAEEGRTEDAIEQYREALRFLPGDERAISGLEELGETYEATETADPHSAPPSDAP